MKSSKQRRAFSQAEAPHQVSGRGQAAIAAALVDALSVGTGAARPGTAASLTHAVHSYAARMHPFTARRVLAALELAPQAHLLDPFCGSGTVLVEGTRAGLLTTGVDASALAVQLARAKATRLVAAELSRARQAAAAIAELVYEQGRAARGRGAKRATGERPPRPESERDRALAGWFDPHVRREVEALLVEANRESHPHVRLLLRVCLSAILVKVSRRESETSDKKVDKRIARGMPARLFVARVLELTDGLAKLGRPSATGTTTVEQGDARKLATWVAPRSVDAIVTSPPYAGTYDYMDHQALRTAFLRLGAWQTREMGSRESFRSDPRRAAFRWRKDFHSVMTQMAAVLKPKGRLVLLMGDSLAGGRALYADRFTEEIAGQVGFRFVAAAAQGRLKLGAREQEAFGPLGKREHLLWFERG